MAPNRDAAPRGANDVEFRREGEVSRLKCRTMSVSSTPVLAIYPGSFDPVTNGHLDLIGRGAKIFDRLIVAVLRNMEKDPLFTVNERLEMLREVTRPWPNVEVDVFEGLLMAYARQKNAQVVLRGIRAISDYEFELQMALMNRKLEPTIETVFMMPAETYSYLSSRLVREIAQLGGSVKDLVPSAVEERLKRKLRKKSQGAKKWN